MWGLFQCLKVRVCQGLQAQKCDSSDTEEYLDFVLQLYPQKIPQTPDDGVRLFLFLSSISSD